MSKQETYIEWTANIEVHQPVKNRVEVSSQEHSEAREQGSSERHLRTGRRAVGGHAQRL